MSSAGDSVQDESENLVRIVEAARPRYHFACSTNLFYEREPYMNKDRGAGAHATRFISLGSVGNVAKAKWLHALALEAAESMPAKDLCAVPDGSTKTPFTALLGQKRQVAFHSHRPQHMKIMVFSGCL
jgi:hypothetical protein